MSQKTDFEYEILVHDDASTDGTADIVREFESKYPSLIRPIYQKENQYSKGVNTTDTLLIPMVRGKYIAMCEGDDYWIDPFKLQKQYDALEKHDEVDICAHAAYVYRHGKKSGDIAPEKKNTIIPFEKVLNGGGNFVATASLMYRKSLHDNPPAFRKFMPYDYTLQMYGALRGGLLYISDYMCVYNLFTTSSWTISLMNNQEKYISYQKKSQHMLDLFNNDTERRYNEIVERLKNHSICLELMCKREYGEIINNRYLYNSLSRKEKLKLWAQKLFPGIVEKIRKKRMKSK